MSASLDPVGVVHRHALEVADEPKSWEEFRTFLCLAAGTSGLAVTKLDSEYLSVIFNTPEKRDKWWWEDHLTR